MTSNKPLIVWQKWIDPFGKDSNQSRWTDYENQSPDIDFYSKEDTDTDTEDKPPPKQISDSIKVIASPMGLIPYNEHTASGKIFNFWTGHTNFNITKNIMDILESVDGVETLDVFTRYRFRIAIGKCFDDSLVMNQINKTIYNFLDTKNEY
jgi:hypothetical protein